MTNEETSKLNWENIFDNDHLDILKEDVSKRSQIKTIDQRLVDGFMEINTFYIENKRLPENSYKSIQEHKLFNRLKYMNESPETVQLLKIYDVNNILNSTNIKDNSTNYFHEDEAYNYDIFNLKNLPIQKKEVLLRIF